MLENVRRGSCREVRAEMEMDEQGRAERKGERVVRKRGVERAREYRISSRVRRARSGRRIKEHQYAAYIAGLSSVDWGCARKLMVAVTISSSGSFAPTIRVEHSDDSSFM
ncbi:hypothetical protein F5050DRAFT_327331 [Lentinula boryana]|uniref:Uncharacterized protein n=1 Tax=Lentinula boryana TaxID=40481 RepID=A0ABQ8QA50_9AGAR|nr:hypothetical protein F5050DRAFT_327331 [Lentinula boryana]